MGNLFAEEHLRLTQIKGLGRMAASRTAERARHKKKDTKNIENLDYSHN